MGIHRPLSGTPKETMIDRRGFLVAVGICAAAPRLLASGRLVLPARLHCERFVDNDPSSFVRDKIRISKGQYSFECCASTGQDVLDIHGLCATVEWAYIVRDHLNKNISITNDEFIRIFRFLQMIRGPHDCVWSA